MSTLRGKKGSFKLSYSTQKIIRLINYVEIMF
jgi:hypothetical protein